MQLSDRFHGPVLLTALATAFFTMGSSAVLAQGTAEERSDCMGNAFEFCSAVIPDVAKIEACLKGNMSQLSPECRAEFAANGRTRLRPEQFR
jgi:hypothetical protein